MNNWVIIWDWISSATTVNITPTIPIWYGIFCSSTRFYLKFKIVHSLRTLNKYWVKNPNFWANSNDNVSFHSYPNSTLYLGEFIRPSFVYNKILWWFLCGTGPCRLQLVKIVLCLFLMKITEWIGSLKWQHFSPLIAFMAKQLLQIKYELDCWVFILLLVTYTS